MSYEEIYGRGDRHESQSAYLDEKKYDDLSEGRKIGIEILYHEPRHASGAGRGKKRVYEESEPGDVVDAGIIKNAVPISITATKLSIISLIGVRTLSAIYLIPNFPFIVSSSRSVSIIHHIGRKDN